MMHKPVIGASNQALFTTLLFLRQFKSLFYDWFKKTDHKIILRPRFYFGDVSSQPLENFHEMDIYLIDSCAEAKNGKIFNQIKTKVTAIETFLHTKVNELPRIKKI